MAGSATAASIPVELKPLGVRKRGEKSRLFTSLCRTAYVALRDKYKLVPEFVSRQLTPNQAMGCLKRKDSFV